MQITIGYLAGVFSQADLKKAPSLEEMLDDKPKASQPPAKPEELKQNAQAWIAVLDGMSGSAKPKAKELETGDDSAQDC